ncbi:(4Fe-4S)-binding protein [Nocardiopsis sediminis]|uniref:(4Fe-4S)-binding protein n=1 Tax=Nocardiopsis sediminis TaxID=1778267 RepID=A0ABV8FMV7_9ACTN
MSGGSEKKAYEGRSITVTFEARRCRHAAECVRGLPEVFDTARRPWIQPDRAPADRLAEVVRRCPSGALQYRLADEGIDKVT